MRILIIKSKTENGDKALLKGIEDDKKESLKNKIVFKTMGFVKTFNENKPYTLTIEVKNKQYQQIVKAKDFETMLIERMKENGAENITDYEIQTWE